MPSFHDRFESRPDRHLGLAKADIAEYEPVHRAGVLHVGLDILDGGQLIGSLFEGKRGVEFMLPGLVRRVGVALSRRPRLVKRYDLLGHRRHSFPDL